MNTHGQSPLAEVEDIDLQKEQSTEEYQDISRGDEQILNTWVSLGVVGGMFYAQDRANLQFAYDYLKNPNAEELLNFKDPSYYSNVRDAHRFSYKLTGQKEGSKYYMSKDEVKRRTFSLVTARKLHKRINDAEIEIRIQNTINQFVLNEESSAALRKNIKDWLKEHPGQSIEGGLFAEGRKLYLAQNTLNEKELNPQEKQKLEQIKKNLPDVNKSARQQVIDNQQKVTASGQQLIKDLLDPNKPLITTQDLNKNLSDVENGIYSSAPTTPPQPAATPPPAMPSAPFSTPRFSLPSFSLPSGITQGLGNMFGGLGKMFGGVGKLFAGAGEGLGTAAKAGFGLLKGGASAAAGAASLGTSLAIQAALEIAKRIPVIGTGVHLAEKAILAVILIAIGLPIVLTIIGGVGVFSYITGNNPLKLSSTNERTIGWYEFDKEYLTTQSNALTLDSSAPPQNDKEITWQQFEKSILTPQKPYLSLEKISR